MTVTPHTPFDQGEILQALCIAREARNGTYEAKLGVAWTLRNRCAMAPAQGFKSTMDENVLKPWAFSSFSYDPNPHGDGNWYPVMPDAGGAFPGNLTDKLAADPIWQDCLRAIRESATGVPPAAFYRVSFYWSAPLTAAPVHEWGPTIESCCIGGLHFCVLA